MANYWERQQGNAAVIRAMLKDDEFMAGGIFAKEDYYMRRYGLTMEQIQNMETHVYRAVTAGIAEW